MELFYQTFDNRQTQTCALVLRADAVVFLAEGFKHVGHKLWGHTDSGVTHLKGVQGGAIFGLRLGGAQGDDTFFRGKFHCVAQQVGEYLVEQQLIAFYKAVG